MFFRRADPVVDRLVALGIRPDDARRLSRAGTLLDLPPGTILCTEGERGTQAFLILEGGVQVHARDAVIPLGPGEVVGELATLDSRRARNATVVADAELSVLVFDVGTFRSLAGHEELAARLAPARHAA